MYHNYSNGTSYAYVSLVSLKYKEDKNDQYNETSFGLKLHVFKKKKRKKKEDTVTNIIEHRMLKLPLYSKNIKEATIIIVTQTCMLHKPLCLE
jgi:hypothetical protein